MKFSKGGSWAVYSSIQTSNSPVCLELNPVLIKCESLAVLLGVAIQDPIS